jgi:hypothetical protein
MTNRADLIDAYDELLSDIEGELSQLSKRKRYLKGDDLSALEADDADDDDDDDGDDGDDGEEGYDDLDAGDDDDSEIAKATKFQAMIDKTAREQGVSKVEAARRVRDQFPDIANGYDALPETSKSYRSLVDAEIRKGNSEVVARQKVAYSHPDVVQSHISKAGDGFENAVAKIQKRDNVDRCTALRKARLEGLV